MVRVARVFHMEIQKALTADLSSQGTRCKCWIHFSISARCLQRNGKSIAVAEGERRRIVLSGERFEENSITTKGGEESALTDVRDEGCHDFDSGSETVQNKQRFFFSLSPSPTLQSTWILMDQLYYSKQILSQHWEIIITSRKLDTHWELFVMI